MTIFSKIVQGEIPSYRCAENDEFYAFLDINPLAQGHTLVVPKREVDYFFDLTDEELSRMIVFAKRVAADMAQRREERTTREAEARALEGVEKTQPKKKKGAGVKRSRVTKSAQGIKVSMPSKKKE